MTDARRGLVATMATLAALAALVGAAGAAPRAPTAAERSLAGRAIMSPKAFPPSFASEAAFLRAMRSMDKKVFYADSKGVWEVHYMAFFPVALDESTCEVHVFDITDKAQGGKSRHVETNTELVGQRGSRTLASTLVLQGPDFKPNRNYRMIVARRSDRGLLAKATFQLRAHR